jgi:hypothetical protein
VTFQQKLAKLASDKNTNAADAENLRVATAAKAQSDGDVAEDILDVAASVKAARGGFVVDSTVSPPILYQSADGLTFTSFPISSVTEDTSSVDPAPVDPSPSA